MSVQNIIINRDEETYNLENNLFEENNLLIEEKIKNKKYKKKFNKIKNFLKYFFIVFGIISLSFLLITLVLYIKNIDFQARLSYTNSNSTKDTTITWSTLYNYDEKYVEYFSKNDLVKNKLYPQTIPFISCWPFTRYIHKVDLMNIDYNNTYKYKIYNGKYSSKLFEFTTPLKDKNSTNVLFFGDMGAFGAVSMEKIIDNIKDNSTNLDFFFHLGDISYNLETYFGLIGDYFLSEFEEATSRIPYMVTAGNHETYENFTNYKNRFKMPNYQETQNLFYTIENPPLKIINFNSEAFFFLNMKPTFDNQLEFIIKELNNTNRTKFPWLIATAHRPMYCSNKGFDDCTNLEKDIIRNILEPYFLKYRLTMYLSAHEHSYERTCPIFDGKCQKGYENLSYYNQSDLIYPINVISGAGGCLEGASSFKSIIPLWSKKTDVKSGFGILNTNYTDFLWKEYIVENTEQNIIDFFHIKNNL